MRRLLNYELFAKWLGLAFLLFMSSNLNAAQLSGYVSRVIDGDTIEVKTPLSNKNNQITVVRVRLMNIDAPELSQSYGEWSKAQLDRVIGGRHVRVNYKEYDKYGRIIGLVYTSRNMQVNTWLVCNGAAWVYNKYNNDPVLKMVESEARSKRVGLWHESEHVAPWEWRRR